MAVAPQNGPTARPAVAPASPPAVAVAGRAGLHLTVELAGDGWSLGRRAPGRPPPQRSPVRGRWE